MWKPFLGATALLVSGACGSDGTTVAPARVPSNPPTATACSEHIGDGFEAGAVDASFVYGFGAGALWRLPVSGGAAERLADAPDDSRIESLKADEQALFWVELGDQGSPMRAGHVWRAEKDGSGARAIAESTMPVSLALDSAHVFFTERFGGVFRVDKQGGPVVALVPNDIVDDHVAGGTALSGAYVYFVWSRMQEVRLRRVPREGGPVQDAGTVPSFSVELAAGDNAIFIGGGAESDGVVRRVDAFSRAERVIYGEARANAFALEGGFLYVVTGSQVARVPMAGGAEVVLAESGGRTLAVSGGVVWFGSVERTCQ